MRKILYSLLFVLCFFGLTGFGFKQDLQESEVVEINKKILGKKFSVESFPYYYEENRKLVEEYTKFLSDKNVELVALKKDGFFDAKYTLSLGDANCADYIYYGEKKDSTPHGKGIIFEYVGCFYGDDTWCVSVIGEFEKGKISGNAICYDIEYFKKTGFLNFMDNYEGSYKNGHATGKGIIYRTSDDSLINYLEEDVKGFKTIEVGGLSFVHGDVIELSGIRYYGEVKKGEANGKGTLFDENGKVLFEGTFKSGEGRKGKLYEDGVLLYDGELSDGRYHGKGTLYNSDGSVKYKGKFKYGDIK